MDLLRKIFWPFLGIASLKKFEISSFIRIFDWVMLWLAILFGGFLALGIFVSILAGKLSLLVVIAFLYLALGENFVSYSEEAVEQEEYD
jgi:uncharacterized membrane protein